MVNGISDASTKGNLDVLLPFLSLENGNLPMPVLMRAESGESLETNKANTDRAFPMVGHSFCYPYLDCDFNMAFRIPYTFVKFS